MNSIQNPLIEPDMSPAITVERVEHVLAYLAEITTFCGSGTQQFVLSEPAVSGQNLVFDLLRQTLKHVVTQLPEE
jgi:hypothetical protein